ncbi:hypothetical protein JAAARDRAFT_188590 [Jaapia argillacea MUCL 33604]|uniref:PUM-HD domain-containing protein n=1 Tax=Jaapia argillacea MUCL 33604 TaxID=933084 RepID=A0A067QHJ2_9AGAM|nr:hypothetical protein JAAARDRAFT_188590 [Jaapia argillacea MUCL 33604]
MQFSSSSYRSSFDPFQNSAPAESTIWAPQPQPSDSTWPSAINSFSRVANDDPRFRRNVGSRKSPTALHGDQDVFGPVGFAPRERNRDVGAIGDGRKSSNSPEFDDALVEQLFRTLNLNSPAPFVQPSSLLFNHDDSPDMSPTSATSGLMTPSDLSPHKPFDLKLNPAFDSGLFLPSQSSGISPVCADSPSAPFDLLQPPYQSSFGFDNPALSYPSSVPFFEPFSENPSPAPGLQPSLSSSPNHFNRSDAPLLASSWRQDRFPTTSEWVHREEAQSAPFGLGLSVHDNLTRPAIPFNYAPQPQPQSYEPINFLSLLHPSSSPPYHVFVSRIIKSSDQQASIFLQQKLKVADLEERAKIVDAICSRGFEMMAHRLFGNWAVQRCLEAASSPEERRKIVGCMRGRVVELAMNCYGCHVLQKALDSEEDIRLVIVSELLLGDPAQTLVNKHASHVWSKIMELTWTAPAPPIFAYVNKALKGKWAALACHETGSLVVQHAFENLEESAKDDIVDELLNQGSNVFGQVAKNQWGSYCIQHILEHGSPKHRKMALDHLLLGLLDYATNEQGAKSVTKALKEGGKDTLDRIIKRMCEPAKGGRRATIVDLALSTTGSQLIAAVLPNADKDQRTLLYDSIRGHIVTLRGCKTGSKVIWLFDRMRAYYGY